MKTHTGIIHGNIIELFENPGLPEGQEVEIQVTIATKRRPPGDGLHRCAGALADDWTEADDRILDELQRDRQNAAYRELPE